MDRPSSTPDREFAPLAPKAPAGGRQGWGPRGIFNSLRTQLISGLIFTLPIVITFWIIYWIFMTLERFLLNPDCRHHPPNSCLDEELPRLPGAHAARLVVQRRVARAGHRAHAGDPLRHGAVLQVVGVPNSRLVAAPCADRRHDLPGGPQCGQFAGAQLRGGADFKRVVLVPFPHPGARSLAFVTNSLHDVTTGRTILTVCVLTGVMPPAGIHPVRARRVGDQYRLDRQRNASGHPVGWDHRAADHPFF